MADSKKTCQNCKGDFVIDSEDFKFYEKIKVPPPTFCPDCRAARRMVFWNERHLFRKPDARTGKEIFSTYPKASPITIYDHDYWWSDKWDPMKYGRDVDFSRPFLEQMRKLSYEVPWASRSIKNLKNSEYCNQASDLKNCYLCFNAGAHGDTSEDCLYGVAFLNMRSSVDFYQTDGGDYCYETFSTTDCYQTFFTAESSNCRNTWFSLNCENCNDCFGCVNLRHKKYHIFNKPYSKEAYSEALKGFDLGSYKGLTAMKKRVYEFWDKFPMKYIHGTHNTNVVGDYVYHSKNVKYSFQGIEMDNVRYSQNMAMDIWDSWDYTNWGGGAELMYECISCGKDCRNLKFCFDCWPGCQDLEYSMSCHSSSNLFGCVGLNKKQYCILNKEYSPGDYKKLRAKIIEHMDSMPYTDKKGRLYKYGEFFPAEFSPLAYNESSANDYFPLNKEKAVQVGFLWRDPEVKEFSITLQAENLPDHINDTPKSILKEIIGCPSCKRAYRIIAPELEFYKRFGLPLPRKCPDCRYEDRIKFRNPIKWYPRKCMCAGKMSSDSTYLNANLPHKSHKNGDACPNSFETTYAPERKNIVYCEECYQAEII